MTAPLAVAFVWHMHQPHYRRPLTGEFSMPWVRLHALKDYWDMVAILDDFPTLHQTFNLVPSLVAQLETYASGDYVDVYWEHTLGPAADLDRTEIAFVLERLCDRSWHPRVQRYPRYLELALKKERCWAHGLDACLAEFTVAELRDLQIWAMLAWFDPVVLEAEPLASLVSRGRDFTEADKQTMADVQRDLLARILPTYRRARDEGRIELTTSPYYHPILPLLINTDSARVARGDIALPPRRFAHPEDAREQIVRGLDAHQTTFGARPRGMWCSEMSVGEDVLPLLAEFGVGWTIADEGLLARSLGRDLARSDEGHLLDPSALYRPYRLHREGRELSIVFRDHVLSDLLGFTYQSWDARDAANNLLWRLGEARKNLADSAGPHLVTIALDGENAWEYYPRDGRDFLHRLYEGLAADPDLACVTVSEHLAAHPPTRDLDWLHTGSWINADFSTWMGDAAHGPAWELLHRTRDAVAARRAQAPDPDADATAGATPSTAGLDQAWEHVLIAQGSDWFWWFGDHQESGYDHLWDEAFREQLAAAHRLAGLTPPPELALSLLADAPGAERVVPSGWLTPQIDGHVAPADEWAAAGLCRAARGGAMQRAQRPALAEVSFGRDADHLYFAFVPGSEELLPGDELDVWLDATGSGLRLEGPEVVEAAVRLHIDLGTEGGISADLRHYGRQGWTTPDLPARVARAEVIEVALPLWATLALLGAQGGNSISFVVTFDRDGVRTDRLPLAGAIDWDLGP
jgi:alpha-amylase/alpha-mannosidase (GH57 family)